MVLPGSHYLKVSGTTVHVVFGLDEKDLNEYFLSYKRSSEL